MSRPYQFSGQVEVVLLDDTDPEQAKTTRQLYRTTKDFTVTLPDGRQFTVPEGFVTDFGSVPWFGRPYVSNENKAMGRPTLFHDWSYAEKPLTREEVDDHFRGMLVQEGMRPAQAWIVHRSVRIGGGGHWERRAA